MPETSRGCSDGFLSMPPPHRRRGAGEHDGAELKTKLTVLDPASFGGQPFSRTNGRQRADHCDQVSVPFGFDLEDAEAIFLIEERDALNEAGEALRQCRQRLAHER
jgi:hypothetical protein